MSENTAESDAASEGWVPFGALIEHPGPVEFSTETDEAGMPLWERVIPPGSTDSEGER